MIVCFSGTGNTRSAALQLAARLGDSHVVFPDAAMLRDPGSAVLMPGEQDSCIVWAFPVYGWGMPPVVERLIRSAKLEGRGALLPHYMLATCGDDIGRTDRHWRRAMADRGWKAAGAFVVRMPNTFVFMPGFNVDSEAVATRKLSDAPAVIARIADMIGGKIPVEDIVIPGAMPGLKSGLLRSFFWNVYAVFLFFVVAVVFILSFIFSFKCEADLFSNSLSFTFLAFFSREFSAFFRDVFFDFSCFFASKVGTFSLISLTFFSFLRRGFSSLGMKKPSSSMSKSSYS